MKFERQEIVAVLGEVELKESKACEHLLWVIKVVEGVQKMTPRWNVWRKPALVVALGVLRGLARVCG